MLPSTPGATPGATPSATPGSTFTRRISALGQGWRVARVRAPAMTSAGGPGKRLALATSGHSVHSVHSEHRAGDGVSCQIVMP